MLAAGKKLQSDWLDAPGLSRGGSRLCEREDFTGQVLQIATRLFLAASVKHHGASPWHLLQIATRLFLAASVKHHGASPWHLLQIATRLFLAASVKHHGASPWHLCASTQSNALTERWAI